MFDQMLGVFGVVIGTVLGYLASYFNNRQQRIWSLNNEYRNWKRSQITNDFNAIFPLVRKFSELAHIYVEYCESPKDKLLKDLLNSKRVDVIRYMNEELTSFPVSLKTGTTKQILMDLDNVTDKILVVGLKEDKNLKLEEMSKNLKQLREIERHLYEERDKMIEKTFN
jgi:hypothetical protein